MHCWSLTVNGKLLLRQELVQYSQAVQDMLPSGQDPLPVFIMTELQHSQENDATISALLPFFSLKKRPSTRERDVLDPKVMALLKQFERLKFQNGVLYRVIKDSKPQRESFVRYP